MIQEFRVRNFLSFKEEQVLNFEPTSDSQHEEMYCVQITEDVKLLKTAYIYGANGSGKSNLLIALNFLSNLATEAQSDNKDKIGVMPFMLDNTSSNESSFFSLIFYINKQKYIYDIELNDDIILKESLLYYPSIRPAKLFTREFDNEANKSIISFGNHVKYSKKDELFITGNTLNNNTVLATLSKVNVGSTILNTVRDYFENRILNILEPHQGLIDKYAIREIDKDPDIKSFVIKILEKTGFNICDLEIKKEEIEVSQEMRDFVQNNPLFDEDKRKTFLDKDKIEHKELVFMHKTRTGIHPLKSGMQSRGTLRYLGMLVLLYDLVKKKNIMLIDEIESGLHYTLLKDFLRMFLNIENQESQLIFTTHDINILDEDFIRRDVIWFAEKNIDGETELVRLSSKGLHKNVSIYNSYKKGNLGGIPNIENTKGGI